MTLTAPPPGTAALEDLRAALSAEAARLAAEHGVPGVALGVVRGDEELVVTTGLAHAKLGRPVTERTLFLVGSTTKTLVGTALGVLVEQGRLDWEDLVVEAVPELRTWRPQVADALRVRHLVSHTSGWRGDAEAETGWGDDALERALAELLPGLGENAPPGGPASYDNVGVALAGLLLGRVHGGTFEAAVTALCLEPCGMTDSALLPWELVHRDVAVCHLGPDRVLESWPQTRLLGPMGGLASTAGDQLRWARAHLGRPGSPFSQALRDDAQSPHASFGAFGDVGRSWLLPAREGARLVQHGGNVSGVAVSSFVLLPDLDAAVTVLTNGQGGGAVSAALTEHVLTEVLGVPPRQPLARERVELPEASGRYAAGQWDLVLDAGPEPTLAMVLSPDVPADIAAGFDQSPKPVVVLEGDVVATPDGGSVGDLVRDASGQVAFLRWGLRLAARTG